MSKCQDLGPFRPKMLLSVPPTKGISGSFPQAKPEISNKYYCKINFNINVKFV